MKDIDFESAQKTAARIAARAEIRDVRLLSTEAELVKQPDLAGGLTYEFSSEIEVSFDEGSPFFVVEAKYEVGVTEASKVVEVEEPPEATLISTIRFRHAGLFELKMREGDGAATEDEIEAYANCTGQMALYPYAREYIHNLTGRLGLPALTVGVLSFPSKPPVDSE